MSKQIEGCSYVFKKGYVAGNTCNRPICLAHGSQSLCEKHNSWCHEEKHFHVKKVTFIQKSTGKLKRGFTSELSDTAPWREKGELISSREQKRPHESSP